jgi:hypothetical protein
MNPPTEVTIAWSRSLPPVLRSPGLSLQAEPSGGAAAEQDFSQRSTINMVAGAAMSSAGHSDVFSRNLLPQSDTSGALGARAHWQAAKALKRASRQQNYGFSTLSVAEYGSCIR